MNTRFIHIIDIVTYNPNLLNIYLESVKPFSDYLRIFGSNSINLLRIFGADLNIKSLTITGCPITAAGRRVDG